MKNLFLFLWAVVIFNLTGCGGGEKTATADKPAMVGQILSVKDSPVATKANASSYEVSGSCDESLGQVTITIGTGVKVVESASCLANSYSAILDVSSIITSPMVIVVKQGDKTASPVTLPENDQTSILKAPEIPDQNITNEEEITLSVQCSELGESVTFTNSSLNPNSQTYTCHETTVLDVTLTFATEQETSNSNLVIVSSVDVNENPTTNNTEFNLPIDHVAPVVSIQAGSDILQGSEASFTVTVTDGNSFVPFKPMPSSGTVNSGDCSLSSCQVTVTGATPGTLTLTVDIARVEDVAGNSNLLPSSGNLMVNSSSLTLNNLPIVTQANASSYDISGFCDDSAGEVTVSISSPESSRSAMCSNGSYSIDFNASFVESDSMTVKARQNNVTKTSSVKNDQTGPESAPTATSPGGYIGGNLNYNLLISCNEPKEIVSIRGLGIDPSPQTHTCTGAQEEGFSLTLTNSYETSNLNNLTISSTDEYLNPSRATTTVNVPVDTKGPEVEVSNNENIVQGQRAEFSIAVTDLNISTLSYTVNTSGVESLSYNCNTNPCLITTGVIQSAGELTLSVEANAVTDDVGNMGDSVLKSSTLTVAEAGTLSFNNPLSTINSQNASTYLVSGSCDDSLGDVTVSVNDVDTPFVCNSPGQFEGRIDLSSLSVSPVELTLTQGVKTVPANPFPVNDQTPIANAPTVGVQEHRKGTETTLDVNCNEAGEVLSFSGFGLNPSPQEHNCSSPLSNPESISLSLSSPIETQNLNRIDLNSEDKNGNPTTTASFFHLPIDNVAPVVSIEAGSDIIVGQTALFTITVEDGNTFESFTPISSSGTVSPSECSLSTCEISVTGAGKGLLTLTVPANRVVDIAGNSNIEPVSDSLTINEPNLTLDDLPVITQANASSYSIRGNCDAIGGRVLIRYDTAHASTPCLQTNRYDINVTNLRSRASINPLVITVEQGGASITKSVENDQISIPQAPTIVSLDPTNELSANVSVECNEAQEVVTFSNDVLKPNPQRYTCVGTTAVDVNLTFKTEQETLNPNFVTVSSVDKNENPTTDNTQFSLPVDHIGPRVEIMVGPDIIQGNDGSFRITVEDENTFMPFTPIPSSGTVSPSECSSSPCEITVTGADIGLLTLTVGAGDIVDAAKNSNTTESSASLRVTAFNLAVNDLPIATQANASSYEVSGHCDNGLGDVTVRIKEPEVLKSVNCLNEVYSASLDVSSVRTSPMVVVVEQGGNTAHPVTPPGNDQISIPQAPTIDALALTNEEEISVSVECSEVGEVVTFLNDVLHPNPQKYTCVGTTAVDVNLTFKTGQETSNPNFVIVSSVDVNENPTTNDTQFNLPVDHVAPVVSIEADSDIIVNDTASFTITVEDGNTFESFTPISSSGTVSPSECLSSPCEITVTEINNERLTVTIGAGDVVDAAGNANIVESSATLTIAPDLLCPENYVSVPSLDGYTRNNFCIMKYEAKDDGEGNVLAIASGTPYINISRDDAITKCQELGEGFDLITNDEWQTVARNIELVGSNWKNSTVGDPGGLSTGHSDGAPNGMLAASIDDNESCFSTEQTCDGETWNNQRRTQTLSNGQVIWDMAGNAREWIKDDNTSDYIFSRIYASQVTTDTDPTPRSFSIDGVDGTPRVAKDQFSPAGDYTSLSSSPYGGLGRFVLSTGKKHIVRGSKFLSNSPPSPAYQGLFTITTLPFGTESNLTGFRCAYHHTEGGPMVSIDSESLEDINASNAKNFRVSGSCSEGGQPVNVSVGGVSPVTAPNCFNEVWETTVDVTSLNKTSGTILITADHASFVGVNVQVSKNVTNNFICPENFVGVPSLQGYTTNSFCVMKYEAKNDGANNAVSMASGLPYVSINRDDAIAKCQAMGADYDLMTNDEWQTLARNIELVGDNWRNSIVGDVDGLSKGNISSATTVPVAASSDDNDSCFGLSRRSCDSNIWHDQRRTQTLSNGEIIWDVSGNAFEWVKDDNTVDYGVKANMSQVTGDTHQTLGSLSGGTTTTPRVAKDQFGPSGDYTALNSEPYGGLGELYSRTDTSFEGILRGGAILRSSSGIFSTIFSAATNTINTTFGFRCVKHP